MSTILENYQNALKNLETTQHELFKEIDRVIQATCKAFGRKKATWELPDGELNIDYHDLDQPYISVWAPGRMRTRKWDYSIHVPVKFLSMTEEEIKTYIFKELQEDVIAKLKKESEKGKKDKDEWDLILRRAEILSRLTPEERKIIGVE